MTYKIKILEKMLLEMEKKRQGIAHDINNDPTSELIKIQLEFNDWLKDTQGKGIRTSKESIKYINDLNDKQEAQEKRLKNYDSNKLINQLVDLDMETKELHNQIYREKAINKRSDD